MSQPSIQQAGLTEVELSAWGERLGRVLRHGDVVLLEGVMGAGKTTLTRAIARGLGVLRPDRVCSPTFNICVIHPGPTPLIHVDLFRLGEGAAPSPAFEALGLQALVDELTEDAGEPGTSGVVVVEWADLWREQDETSGLDALRIRLERMKDAPERRNLLARALGPRARARLQASFADGSSI